MDHLKKINDEVYYTNSPLTLIGQKDVNFLKQKAIENNRKRVRICAHNDINDTLHEMIIALADDIYVVPHKHLNKTESFHLIEGHLLIFIFNNEGDISHLIKMGAPESGDTFYARISADFYHTVIPLSRVAIFHETTHGPFNPAKTVNAPWAPNGNNPHECIQFIEKLKNMRP